MVKKHTRNRRHKRRIARTIKMTGGAYSQTEMQELQNAHFSENQIQSLQEMDIPFNEVLFRINQLRNIVPDDNIAEQIMVEILNEQIFQNSNAEDIDAIPHAQDDAHDMDISFNGDDNSLHLSDLNVSQDSMNANTTAPDESFGNSQMSNGSFASETGGKRRRRKTRKNIKRRNSRKNRKQRGGMCYGNGVGANSNDPNYSIYNTNMLKLFPYRTQ
jgi:hypothetical protein